MMPSRIPEPGDIEVIDEATAAMFRAMTPAHRVRVASNAHQAARAMLKSRAEQLHPDWSSEEIHREVARRFFGHDAVGILEALG